MICQLVKIGVAIDLEVANSFGTYLDDIISLLVNYCGKILYKRLEVKFKYVNKIIDEFLR